jgi:hypothetical protein
MTRYWLQTLNELRSISVHSFHKETSTSEACVPITSVSLQTSRRLRAFAPSAFGFPGKPAIAVSS